MNVLQLVEYYFMCGGGHIVHIYVGESSLITYTENAQLEVLKTSKDIVTRYLSIEILA